MTEKTIGSYKVIKRIGEGGMAKVYLAVHKDVPNLKVVLKILSDPRLVERFRSEADKLALLDGHGKICQIKHFFNHGDDIVIAMEYIDGQPLDELIKDTGQLSMSESLRIVTDILDTLEFAHQRGISHRDIKPSNVMIDSKSQVKIIDFGIAKAETDPDLTVAGSACGTPTYMAPEQFNPTGQTDYVRADIYAVGTLLYFLLTGQLPFKGDNAFALRDAKLFNDPPEPRSLNPEIPGALQEIVLKALQKDPEDRYATARQMGEALSTIAGKAVPSRVAASEKTEHIPIKGRKKRGNLIFLLGAALVTVAAVYFFFIRGGIDNGPEIPQMYAPRPNMEIGTPKATFSWEATAGEGGAYTLEFSSDSEFANPRIIKDLTSTSITLPDSLPEGRYFWRIGAVSRDGRSSGFSEIGAFSVKLSEIAGGIINILVNPSGDIFVDDSLCGTGLNQLSVPADAGRHIVSTRNAASRQKRLVDTVLVASGETIESRHRFTFPKTVSSTPKPQLTTYDIRIGSNMGSNPVFGGMVYIDGVLQDNRTPNTYAMTLGKHMVRVTLSHDGRDLDKTDSIVVAKNGEHKLIFIFEE